MREPREILRRNATFGVAGWLLMNLAALYLTIKGEKGAASVLIAAQVFWVPAAIYLTYHQVRAAWMGAPLDHKRMASALGDFASFAFLAGLGLFVLAHVQW